MVVGHFLFSSVLSDLYSLPHNSTPSGPLWEASGLVFRFSENTLKTIHFLSHLSPSFLLTSLGTHWPSLQGTILIVTLGMGLWAFGG